MAFNKDDVSINSLIGIGSAITGDIKFTGFVTVHGDINGNIETSGKIIVGEKARIKGNVTAKSAIIGGIVEGNVTAPEGIQLFETAAVVGDLATKHLLLADNVLFHGHCISLSDEKMYKEARKEWIDVTTINSASLVNPRGGADF